MLKSFFIVLVIFGVLFTSCFTLDNGPKKHRGSLSEAMSKAQDDSEDDREVSQPPVSANDSESGEDDDTQSGDESSYQDTGSDIAGPPQGIALGIEGRYEFPFQDNIKNAYSFAVEAGTGIENSVLLLKAGFEILELNPSAQYAKSMVDPLGSVFLGGEVRITPFSIEEPFNPYALIGYEQGIVFWTYRNAITSSGDTISSDSIITYTLNLGLGSSIVKLEGLSLFINGGFRFRLFGAETQEGFTNDYFNGESYFYVSADVLVKF